MREHEQVLVFHNGKPVLYNPIKEKRKGSGDQRVKYPHNEPKTQREIYKGLQGDGNVRHASKLRNPSTVQLFNNRAKGAVGIHPTQKPVETMAYFIKTYSNEGDVVLDFSCGSGSTGVACVQTNRSFIGIDNGKSVRKRSEYFGQRWVDIAKIRMELEYEKLT